MKARGFTLIEVLVSLLVLAIGVLGVATLQLSTYRQLQTSNNYAIAALLGGDMADRMVANSAEALAPASAYSPRAMQPTTAPDCSATGACTSRPARHLRHGAAGRRSWPAMPTCGGGAGLPSGSGEVAAVTGSTNEFEIIVRWDDDRSGSTGETCPPADDDDLDCHTVIVRL